MVSSAHCRSSIDERASASAEPAGRQRVGPAPDGLEPLLGRLLLGAVGGRRPAAAGVEDLLERGQGQRLPGQLQAGRPR